MFADSGLTNFLNDISLEPVSPAKRRKPVSENDWFNKNKKSLLIGGGVLGALILLAGIVITFKTKDGTLTVTVNEPDAEVQVLNEQDKIEITRKGENGPISISVDPGKHRLKVQKDGFELFTDNFEIESGGKKSITAKLVRVQTTVSDKSNKLWNSPAFQEWMKPVILLPAQMQVDAVAKKLQELNPGFDGKVTGIGGKPTPTIENGVVTEIAFVTAEVTDISPVRALVGLATLACAGSHTVQGQLSDLSPLKGMMLKSLDCWRNKVSDLSPLRGMPLTTLSITATPVSDLSPLKGMKLTILSFQQTQVSDLSPLQGMLLTLLNCAQTNVSDLTPLKGMPLTSLACVHTRITDLSPLDGIPLTSLQIAYTTISDLAPLKGMSLTYLDCTNTPVSDLSPLKGMPLSELVCHATPHISDLSPLKDAPLKAIYCDLKSQRDTELLRSIKTLEQINGKPAAEFWKEVEEKQVAFEAWTKQVAAMPAEKQVEAIAKKLQELNPGFDAKVTNKLVEKGVVTGFGVATDNVTDISPVRALAGLRGLVCNASVEDGVGYNAGKLADLMPLRGMSLEGLYIAGTKVTDLSPLTGMRLQDLNIGATPVSDLSPLKGMPLTGLNLAGTQVSDLSPLRGMPLTSVACNDTKLSELSPLKGMLLTVLHCYSTNVTDLSPLKDMPLMQLWCDFKPERDTDLLRSIKTLETINNKPVSDFWKEVEEQQKGKKP